MNEFEEACALARGLADANVKTFRNGFQADTAGWLLELEDQDFLRRITTGRISDRALLSNKWVHRAAQNALIEAVADAHHQNPGRQWLWITIAWDRGITWERAPYIDTMSLRRIVYGHLCRSEIEGFGVIEVDTWKNLTGEPGRRMVAHSHFLGSCSDGGRVSVSALQTELRGRRALVNSIGAPNVVIIPVKATIADFARVGRYMLKRPAYAKMYRPEGDNDSPELASVRHSRGSVARLVEVTSRLEVGDVMFSIGKGSEIAEKVLKAIKHEIRERRVATPAPSREEVMQHWRRIRLTNGSPLLQEPIIITRQKDRKQKFD